MLVLLIPLPSRTEKDATTHSPQQLMGRHPALLAATILDQSGMFPDTDVGPCPPLRGFDDGGRPYGSPRNGEGEED
jgi:hypothetical protein